MGALTPDYITNKLYIFLINKHYCQIAEKLCKINEKTIKNRRRRKKIQLRRQTADISGIYKSTGGYTPPVPLYIFIQTI